MPNGDIFVGWDYRVYEAAGNHESTPALNTLYDAQMPGSDTSYRTFRSNWKATPASPPSITVQSLDTGITVYASWYGVTQVAAWLAGTSADSLSQTNHGGKTGFETSTPAKIPGPYFQVKALNADDQITGESSVVRFPPSS